MFNDISKQKKLELKSEKEVYDSLQVMLHRCKEQNLDVRTVMRTLLNESINLTFSYSHSPSNAFEMIKNILNNAIDKHIFDDEEALESILIEIENQDNSKIH